MFSILTWIFHTMIKSNHNTENELKRGTAVLSSGEQFKPVSTSYGGAGCCSSEMERECPGQKWDFSATLTRDGSVNRSVHHFGPDPNISTALGWITMKFCTNIHGPHRMKANDFGDPLMFHLAPPAGQILNNLLKYFPFFHVYSQIPGYKLDSSIANYCHSTALS